MALSEIFKPESLVEKKPFVKFTDIIEVEENTVAPATILLPKNRTILLIVRQGKDILLYSLRKIIAESRSKFILPCISIEGLSIQNFLANTYQEAVIKLEEYVKQDKDNRKIIVKMNDSVEENLKFARELTKRLNEFKDKEDNLNLTYGYPD